jgi:hypothetical protein
MNANASEKSANVKVFVMQSRAAPCKICMAQLPYDRHSTGGTLLLAKESRWKQL